MSDTPASSRAAGSSPEPPPEVQDMDDADTANGESPDRQTEKPSHPHATGEDQAQRNAEDDPPA